MDPAHWDERYAASELVWSVTPNQFVAEHLADLTPGSAVDLAAGEGRNAIWLAGRGWQVTAVDFSAVAIDKGRRLAAGHGASIEFVVADALEWAPADPVDLVVLSYLQLVRKQRRAVLARTVEWLNPGGRVFVVAHDQSNVTAGHGGPQSAEVCYDVDETVAALDGLIIDEAALVERRVDTDAGVKVALDTLVIARNPTTAPGVADPAGAEGSAAAG